MLNPYWSNTKRFLSVLVVFGKSFVFAKMSKFLSWVFWQLAVATFSRLDSVTKIAYFAHIGQFLNVFSFSLKHLWLFIVFFVWTFFSITVFTHKFSYSSYSLSSFTNLQVKVWFLFLSQYVLHILLYTSWIVCFCCISNSWIWVFDFWWILIVFILLKTTIGLT